MSIDRPRTASPTPGQRRRVWAAAQHAGLLAVAAVLLAACGLQRYSRPSVHASAARAWAQADAAVDRRALVAGVQVIGLGEAAHGALDVFLARAELSRQWISEGWARTIVLEADAWDVCALDRYVHGDGDDLRAALAATIGLYGHDDSEQFFRWLREHNQGALPGHQVRVRGMDAQSSSACTADDVAACPGRAKYCQQARDLLRSPNLGETYFGRDEIMAANVLDFARESPGGVVVWAHSGHVSRSAPLLFNARWDQTAPMGWFLARVLGAAYLPMTVTFRRGTVSVTALRGGLMWPRFGEFVLVPVPDAPPDTIEGLVGRTAGPVLLDLRTLPMFAGSTAWFAAPRFTRSIGAAEHPRMLAGSRLAHGWGHYVLREAFDAILVLPDTRPTRPWFASVSR